MMSVKSKNLLLLTLMVAAVAFLVSSCGGTKANQRKQETNTSAVPAAVEVTTAPAIRRDLPRFFEATGSLAGDQQTDVAPSIAGKIVEIGVDLGSYVKRGQMIVRLDDVDLKLRVQQAQAQLDEKKASLRQAEERVGVRSGQSFIGSDPVLHFDQIPFSLSQLNYTFLGDAAADGEDSIHSSLS